MNTIDPAQVMAKHAEHKWSQCWDSTYRGDGHCEPYLLAAALADKQAKVQRVEALCLRMENRECLCRSGANQYGAFFIPQPECPSHGHHSALFRAALAGPR